MLRQSIVTLLKTKNNENTRERGNSLTEEQGKKYHWFLTGNDGEQRRRESIFKEQKEIVFMPTDNILQK
jgi:hypothetical protein